MKKAINASVFEDIYKQNLWGDNDSRSGTGSNLVQTTTIRKEIPALLDLYHVGSMLDVPCGDFFWMKEIKEELKQKLYQYYGGDIVDELVKQNNLLYADEKFKFLQLNITNDKLPCVDLILCRDCLVHLSYKDIIKAIRQFKNSGSVYLLTTSFSDVEANKEITTGSWRPLNLTKFPFSFPKPLTIINENCTENEGIYKDKSLLLWKLDAISIWTIQFNLFIANIKAKFMKYRH